VPDAPLLALVALLCAAVTVCAVLAAGWLRASADDLAAATFAGAGHSATQVQVSWVGVEGAERVPPDGADVVDAALPPALRRAYDRPRSVVATLEMVPKVLPARSGEPAYLAVAGFPDAGGLVDVVEGRMPRPGSPLRQLPAPVAREYDGPARAPVVEVVLEESAAEALDMPVGTWVSLSSVRMRLDGDRAAVLRVVGTYRPRAPYPTALDDVTTARSPAISVLPEYNLIRATALAADRETVLGAGWEGPPDVRWTFDLARRPGADEAQALVEEARRVELQTWPNPMGASDARAVTGVGDLAAQVVDQRRASDGLVVLVLAALAAAALTVLASAAVVLSGRRTDVTTVVRARGASTRWLLLHRGREALLLVLPGLLAASAVAAGWGSARGGGVGGELAADLAVGLVAALVCALLVTLVQALPRPAGVLGAVLADALQLALVALAVGAVVLLLGRDRLDPGDPVLVAAAPLLGAAVAVAATRGLRLLLGGLRRAVRRTRSVTPVVALGEAHEVAARVALPAAGVVLALSAGVLAVSVDDTLWAGAERAGWEQVGADTAVRAGAVRDDAVSRLAAVPGVRALAPVFTSDRVSVRSRTGTVGVQLVGVDAATLRRVGDARTRELRLPRPDAGVLQAVASPDLELDADSELLYAQSRVPIEAVDTAERIPGVTGDGAFLLVDLASLRAAVERNLDLYSTVLVEGEPDLAALTAQARAIDPQAVVLSRERVVADQLGAPPVTRTRTLLVAAGGATLLLAGFGVLLVAGLGGPTRRRTARVLAAVGVERGATRRIGVLALLPAVLTACAAALACGLLLGAVAGHGFDPGALTGTEASLPVRPAPRSLLLALGVVVALLALAAGAARPRRVSGGGPRRAPRR
jgi:putative ABC transport system permease protein